MIHYTAPELVAAVSALWCEKGRAVTKAAVSHQSTQQGAPSSTSTLNSAEG
jgi:hypothetical protein